MRSCYLLARQDYGNDYSLRIKTRFKISRSGDIFDVEIFPKDVPKDLKLCLKLELEKIVYENLVFDEGSKFIDAKQPFNFFPKRY